MSEGSNSGRSPATTIAIVGIAATALVGIAGSAISWLVAGANRETQTTLARDARIYDKRASAYVDTLMEMQALSDDMRLLRFEKVPIWPNFQHDQGNLRARMYAYATLAALRLYNQMFFGASDAMASIERLRESGRSTDRTERARLWLHDPGVRRFETARRGFQILAAAELSGTTSSPAPPGVATATTTGG